MINIYYLINQLTKLHKVQVGSKLHKFKCYVYNKIKTCPNCKKNMYELNSENNLYKIPWVMCPSCGYVHCTRCMKYPNGFGVCPICHKK